MNLKKLTSSAIALSVAAVVTGCASSQETEKPKPVIIAPETIILDWQNSYQGKLDEFMKSDSFSEKNSRFDLRDITGDGTPELIMSPNDDKNTRCIIYSYSKGTLTPLPEMGSEGTIPYLPLRGLLHDEYRGEGFVLGKYVTYEGGEFVPVLSYSDNTASAASGANIRHEINGESVTLPQYDEIMEEYQNSTTIHLGRKYTFGKEAVSYAVHSSESWSAVMTDTQKRELSTVLTKELSETGSAGILGAAFEIVDLNDDDVPELIISEPTGCRIYMFTGDMMDKLKEADGTYGNSSSLMLDIGNSTFYSDSKGETSFWSLKEGFSAADYTSSGSLMECGNKLLLSVDNIEWDVYGPAGDPAKKDAEEGAEDDGSGEAAAGNEAEAVPEDAPADNADAPDAGDDQAEEQEAAQDQA